jgi:hypothetical protein
MWGQQRDGIRSWWGKDAELEPAAFAMFRKGVLAFLFLGSVARVKFSIRKGGICNVGLY